eukprot:8907724-Lingulodinium_polyedra.AAC.1
MPSGIGYTMTVASDSLTSNSGNCWMVASKGSSETSMGASPPSGSYLTIEALPVPPACADEAPSGEAPSPEGGGVSISRDNILLSKNLRNPGVRRAA